MDAQNRAVFTCAKYLCATPAVVPPATACNMHPEHDAVLEVGLPIALPPPPQEAAVGTIGHCGGGAMSASPRSAGAVDGTAPMADSLPPKSLGNPSADTGYFCSLGMPFCEVRAALQRHEAAAQLQASPFAPCINSTSARLQREQPVEDVLLGKGRLVQQKRERAVKLQEFAARSDSARLSQRPSKSTEELARRYSERTGLTASQRLYHQSGGSHDRRMTDGASSPPASRRSPRDPVGSAACLHHPGVATFRTIPSASAQPASVRSVAERNAAWSRQRDQRILQLANRQQRSERQQCPFRPAVGGAAYLAAVGGTSSLDVVARGAAWQATREHRLQAARDALLAREAVQPARPRSADVLSHGAEPAFMVPTKSATHRVVSLGAASSCSSAFGDSCKSHLPEWAAPRADASWSTPAHMAGCG